MDLEELKCEGVRCTQLVQDRTQCCAVVNTAVKLRFPKRGEFLNQLLTSQEGFKLYGFGLACGEL
jgi:hypothetical protein